MTIQFDGKAYPKLEDMLYQPKDSVKKNEAEINIGSLLKNSATLKDNSKAIAEAREKNKALIESGEIKIPTEWQVDKNIKPKAKSLDLYPEYDPKTGKYLMLMPDGSSQVVPNDTGYAPPGMKPNPLYKPGSGIPEYIPFGEEIGDILY